VLAFLQRPQLVRRIAECFALAASEAGDAVAIYTRDRVLAREAIRLGVGWE
jgi:hypothetical protein